MTVEGFPFHKGMGERINRQALHAEAQRVVYGPGLRWKGSESRVHAEAQRVVYGPGLRWKGSFYPAPKP